ncbi:MAG: Inositol 2-dehydrogenase [Verrucomicrobia subdivision 3 bacterium]|nr:Inositol 2-dehydrogenase [Limisphaerales bacterium]MCS1417081.1 Inositol 2-dehydrogenase [Limisphaerales bacterium]
MKPLAKPLTRRRFVKSTVALAAASTLPQWHLNEYAAQPAAARPKSPNDRLNIGLVGCGGMGRANARQFAKLGNLAAVCDVDDLRAAQAKKEHPGAKVYQDFRNLVARKDIDIVICGTVDHWHTLVSIAAMRAGKDVYCEKPLTLTIDEGKHLINVANETKRILQTGSQQRSNKIFRLACELVRNGRIGKLKHVDTFLPSGPRQGPFEISEVPATFNHDFWMGSTPWVPYIKERTHVSFRYYYAYSGGTMTDWGAHHNDIALWGMGMERSGPDTIDGKALVKMIPGGFTAASDYRVRYTYANGVTHTCQSTNADDPSGRGVKNGQRHGIRFTGTDGWIFVTRGAIKASEPEFLTEPLPSNAERLYVSHDHRANLIECARTRKQAICEPTIGHRSATVCHLGVISMRLGRKLQWDPKREQFIGDREANTWLAREMRAPWNYEAL